MDEASIKEEVRDSYAREALKVRNLKKSACCGSSATTVYASYETTTILRPAYYSYLDEYMPLNPGGRQPLLAHTKQTEYCLGPLPFSEPARLTIDAVGVGFRQLTHIAVSALFSFAEKVLGIFLTPQYGCAQ